MKDTLPRPVLWIGTPALVALFGVALWAWARYGLGVFFDAASNGLSLCL